jgi:HlyD family secretion protein
MALSIPRSNFQEGKTMQERATGSADAVSADQEQALGFGWWRRVPPSWIVVGLALLCALAAAGLAWRQWGAEPKIAYITRVVAAGSVTRTVTATGTVNPVLTIVVGSYVSGAVQRLYCDYNTRVRPGQICAKIDPRPYQTKVDQDKANLAVARAQLEKDKANLAYAKVNHERLEKLALTNAVSKDAADNARSNYGQAAAQIVYDEASIAQRRAELEAALVNLEYTNIVSPVSGAVVSRNVTAGQTVAASFQTPTLFLIATDLTKMQVDANVSESDIGGVNVGDKTSFTVDAFPKRVFEGVVAQVRQSPQTVQNVVTFDVVISVGNSDLALKPGLTAATRIVIDERTDVLRVPDEALRYKPTSSSLTGAIPKEGEQAAVWVLRQGRPVRVPIEAGLDDDSFTEVKAGLNAGDAVIVSERAGKSRAAVPPPRL